MKTLKLFVVGMAMLLLGCSKDDTPDEVVNQNDFAIVETGNSQFPVAANNFNGEHIAVEVNPLNQVPKGVFYKNTEVEAFIEIDANGIPKNGFVNDHLLIFANYEGETIDMAIIDPEGRSEIFRDLNISDHLLQSFHEDNLGKSYQNGDLTTALKIGGLGVSIMGCALSAATILPSAGLTLPLAIGCGSTLLSTIATVNEWDGTSSVAVDTFSSYANLIGCILPSGAISCIGYVLDIAGMLSSAQNNMQQEYQAEFNLNSAALQYGYGAIQITLTWDNIADLDLHVTDPTGETIYYANPTSASGGQLDVDDIDGYGPENIFWTTGTVVSGNYSVEVNHYSGPSPANFDIRMEVFGDVQFFSGSISSDQTIAITSFARNQIFRNKTMYLIHKEIDLPAKEYE